MQRVLLIMNLILLLAVGYLLIDKFTSGKEASASTTDGEQVENGATLSIVYVNVDTLLNNYELFKSKQQAISAREQEEDGKLRNRGKALEREIMALQQKASTGTMTPKDLQLEEERLMRKQQEFLADQERISKSLMEETGRMNDELQAEIVRVIKVLKEEKGYDYVFSYGIGSPLLAAGEQMDITPDVLAQLNSQASGN